MTSYAFFIHRSKDPFIVEDVKTVVIKYEDWSVHISYSLALTGNLKNRMRFGYPFLNYFTRTDNLKRVFAGIYQPPGKLCNLFGKNSVYVALRDFWTDDTAAVINQQIRPLVLENQVLVREWRFGHHELHDIAQDISVCLSILINADWIKEQDHWGQQFRLRQLLLGEDE